MVATDHSRAAAWRVTRDDNDEFKQGMKENGEGRSVAFEYNNLSA